MDPVLVAFATHWEDIHTTVTAEQSSDLDELAAELAGASRREAQLRVRYLMAELLGNALPPGHLVRRAIRDGERGEDIETVDLEDSVALLTLTSVRRSSRLAKLELLAEPGYTVDEVRARGADPDLDGLLRLPTPEGGQRLPAFQFTESGAVPPVIIEINELLRSADDPWGVADWWLRGNSWLGGVPAELLASTSSEELLRAARAVRGEE
ncbi:hypothetical protein ACIBG8_41620 [Nonomuraea sp. NPDC050556]|uniref:hypothetical protein n=1 Tax=Nonomuraea sp. NPDC050556 TaxID=3364369 RepID=UPI0037981DAD